MAGVKKVGGKIFQHKIVYTKNLANLITISDKIDEIMTRYDRILIIPQHPSLYP